MLLKMTSQHVTLLIFSELSAPFDTVDHQIHADVVDTRGTALKWFRSYFCDRSQSVSVHGVHSRLFGLSSSRLMFRASVIYNIRVQAV